MQSKAAKKSAGAIQAGSDRSSETNRYIFDTIRNDTGTQRQAGDAATRRIASLMGLNLDPVREPYGERASFDPAGRYDGGGGVGRGRGGYTPNAFAGGGRFGGERFDMASPVADGGPASVRWADQGFDQGQPGTTDTMYGQPRRIEENAMAPPGSGGSDQTAWLRGLPGYEFNFREGMRGLNTGLASRGQLFSGDAGREAIRYGQNYGDRIYNQERNALFNLAGMGQVSQGQSNQAGQNYANNQSNLNMSTANAMGTSYQNGANAWTDALGGVAGAGMWGLSQYRGRKK